jgi:hypothetical protein
MHSIATPSKLILLSDSSIPSLCLHLSSLFLYRLFIYASKFLPFLSFLVTSFIFCYLLHPSSLLSFYLLLPPSLSFLFSPSIFSYLLHFSSLHQNPMIATMRRACLLDKRILAAACKHVRVTGDSVRTYSARKLSDRVL